MNVSEYYKDQNLDILHSMCCEYAKNKYNIDYNTSSPIYNSLLNVINYTNINKYKFKNLLDMNKYTMNEFDTILSQYKIQKKPPYNNSFPTSNNNIPLDVTENKKFYRPKEEYKELMNQEMNKMKEELDMLANPQKPPEIDFTDKEEDTIDYKLNEEIAKRELEYNSNINSLPPQNNDNNDNNNNINTIKIHHSKDIPLVSKKSVSFNDNKEGNTFLNKLKILSPITNNSNNNIDNNNLDNNETIETFMKFMKNQNEINSNIKQEILELKQQIVELKKELSESKEKINNIEKKFQENLNFTIDN